MKKRFFALLFVLVLAFSLCAVPAWAYDVTYILGFDYGDTDIENADMRAQELYDEYGVAVCFKAQDYLNGMTLAEAAQSIYETEIGLPNGILLVDIWEAGDYYLYITDSMTSIINDETATALCTAYEMSGTTYLEGIEGYLGAASEILAYTMAENVPEGMIQTPSGDYIPGERRLARVVDKAGVLTEEELAELNARADSVSDKYQCDVSVVLVSDTEGKDTKNFAFDFYDYNGYGYGANDDGVMLVVDVVGREFQCISHSFGAYAFTDAGQEYAEEKYISYLKDSDWAGAADAFISVADELLSAARNGAPIDTDNMPQEPFDPLIILVDLVVGFVLSLIPVGIMKRKLKTVNKEYNAASYVRRDSFNLVRSQDRFLHRQISKTPRPKQNNSGGGGGGTSMSTSSSGRSFGSHGGKF